MDPTVGKCFLNKKNFESIRWRLILMVVIFLLPTDVFAQKNINDCYVLFDESKNLNDEFLYIEALTKLNSTSECFQKFGEAGMTAQSLHAIGDINRRLKNHDEALEYLQQALEIYQDLGKRSLEANALYSIAGIYVELGDNEAALEYLVQGLAITRETGHKFGEAAILNNLGDVYSKLGRPYEALEYLQQSLSISQELNDRNGEGIALYLIGTTNAELGQFDKSLDTMQKSLAIIREVNDQLVEGRILNSIGGVYLISGKYDQALEYLQQSLEIRRKIGDLAGEGTTLTRLGAIFSINGQNSQALDFYQQSLEIRQQIGDVVGQGEVIQAIGNVYFQSGQYSQALDNFRQSLAISRMTHSRTLEAGVLGAIGDFYQARGEFDQGLNYYQQALIISQEINNKRLEAEIRTSIGNFYQELGQYELGKAYLQESLSLNQEISNVSDVANNLNDLANSFRELNDYDEALNLFQQSLDIMSEIGNRQGEGAVYYNIGITLMRSGEVKEGIEHLELARQIAVETDNQQLIGEVLVALAKIYGTAEKYDQALEYAKQGLEIRRNTIDPIENGNILFYIGHFYDKSGIQEKALEYYQQAMKVLESARARAGSEQVRSEFIARYATLYQSAVNILYEQENFQNAFIMAERSRGRSFLDSLSTGRVRLSDNDAEFLLMQEQELYNRQLNLQFEIASIQGSTTPDTDQITQLEDKLADVQEKYSNIQQTIISYGTDLASLVPGRNTDTILGVEQVQLLLDQQTTLLSYYQIEDDILAFILTGDSFETVALDVDPAEVAQQINAFREFASTTAAHPASAVKLYEMLVTPLKDKLTGPHLVIIPHQQLHYLPFAALTDGERYLIDDYTLTVLPSASALPFILENTELEEIGRSQASDTIVLTPQSDKLTGKNQDYDTLLPASEIDHIPILVIGNPVTADYDTVASLATTRDSLGSLPFAEKEAKAIAALFGVEPLIGEAATETAVRERVSEANILHLAAHGKFNPVAPLNSLIALAPDNPKSKIENPQSADGWLTVGESYGLNLENTDLVVLSACETNLGDLSAGDELVGLTRALIFAGTPSVIASLWAVEDKATSLLMEQFYTHLRDGVGKAEALRQAQIEVRTEYPNPYYWSGFVLSGDPGDGLGSAGAGEQGAAANSDKSPVAVESEASVEDEAAAPIEAGESQSSGNCLSLLLILGAMGAIGVMVGKRNG